MTELPIPLCPKRKVCGQCRSVGNGHSLSGRFTCALDKDSETSSQGGSESFCAVEIEWKSRSRISGVGAGTKVVSRSFSCGALP